MEKKLTLNEMKEEFFKRVDKNHLLELKKLMQDDNFMNKVNILLIGNEKVDLSDEDFEKCILLWDKVGLPDGFLYNIAYNGSKQLKKVEDLFVQKLNKYSNIVDFAKYVSGVNITKIENSIIKGGNPAVISSFAQNICGANVQKLEEALIKNYIDPYDLYIFASLVEGANINKIGKIIFKVGNIDLKLKFLRDIICPNDRLAEFAVKNIDWRDFPLIEKLYIDSEKLESWVLNSGDPYKAISLALQGRGEVSKLENMVIKSCNPYAMIDFAQYVKTANINKLQDAVIKSGNVVAMMAFAQEINTNVSKIEAVVFNNISCDKLSNEQIYELEKELSKKVDISAIKFLVSRIRNYNFKVLQKAVFDKLDINDIISLAVETSFINLKKLEKAIVKNIDGLSSTGIELICNRISGIDIKNIEDIIIEKGSVSQIRYISEFYKFADIKKLEKAIVSNYENEGDVYEIEQFVKIPGVNIKELETGFIKKGKSLSVFAKWVKVFDRKKLEDTVIKSGDIEEILEFAKLVDESDKKRLINTAIKSINKDNLYVSRMRDFKNYFDIKDFEDLVYTKGDLGDWIDFVRFFKEADVKRFENKIIEQCKLNAQNLMTWALFIEGSMERMQDVLVNYSFDVWRLIDFAEEIKFVHYDLVSDKEVIKSANISKLEDAVIKSKNINAMMAFAKYVEGADVKKLTKAFKS